MKGLIGLWFLILFLTWLLQDCCCFHPFPSPEKATATALFAEPDGTIYLVANNENGTVGVLWSFSTGSPIYSAYHSAGTERYLFYEGGDWSLFTEDPHYKKLIVAESIASFVDNTPRNDGVGPVHGRHNSTLFVVDAETGSLNTSTEPVMYVYRKDYFLYSERSRPKTGFWNMSVAEFSAVCKCQKAIFHVSNKRFIMPTPCGEYFNVRRITNVSEVYMPPSYVGFNMMGSIIYTVYVIGLSLGLFFSLCLCSRVLGGVSNDANAERQTQNEAEEQKTNEEAEDLQAEVEEQDAEKQIKNEAEEQMTKEAEDLKAVVKEHTTKGKPKRSDLKTFGNIEVSNEVIGQGSHGSLVYAGYFKPSDKEIDKQEVAVKRLIRGHQSLADKEIRILLKLKSHGNVVRYFGSAECDDFVYLATERCWVNLYEFIEKEKGGGAEFDLWNKITGQPSALLMKLMMGLVKGIRFLHDKKIIHRDLKPQNILLKNEAEAGQDKSLVIKISDMGISKVVPQNNGNGTVETGTRGWRSPEQIKGGTPHSYPSDIFSLGITMFYCLTKGHHPFGDIANEGETEISILNNKMDLMLLDGLGEAKDLISRLLISDPSQRLVADQVFKHLFFWDSEKRLHFVEEVHTVLSGKKKGSLLKLFEQQTCRLPLLKGNWSTKLHGGLKKEARKPYDRYDNPRPYDLTKVAGLVRFIRNKSVHRKSNETAIKNVIGETFESVDGYFRKRFPELIPSLYSFVISHCKGDNAFKVYF